MSQGWIDDLRAIVGEGSLLLEPSDLEPYSRDETASGVVARLPAAVAKPASEAQVAEVVRFCADRGIPVTARGGGTGLAGACVPSPGGIVLSLERLDRILWIDVHNHTITVQAGVPMGALFAEAKKAGLFFPPHPGDEGAFAGGVVATNAGGARAVKYGTVKRFLTGMRVVLADGTALDLGGRLLKSSTGYHLMDLMIGSEGTLGIITQVTFSLLANPACLRTLVVPFETIDQATAAVEQLLNRGITPCAVEFVEHAAIRCSERLLAKTWPARGGNASLMFILDGSDEEEVMGAAASVASVMEANGALDVLVAEGEAKQAEILEIRSMIYEALRPGAVELFDVSLPRSEIPDHVRRVHELEREHGIPLPTYGHAADGNVHTQSMRVSIDDGVLGGEIKGWEEKHERVRAGIYADAIARGGVISGEHGIGLVKKDFLAMNVGERAVRVMKAIKRALDPKGILNPGKIFDLDGPVTPPRA
ncbi:MAG: FAD-binding oxidoreductase [Spirochaetes bacterium]|nr:FAD-binding oxidoreductase [Spirochaetota bacterium]